MLHSQAWTEIIDKYSAANEFNKHGKKWHNPELTEDEIEPNKNSNTTF